MIDAGAELGEVWAIVNNDVQQVIKEGRILHETRTELARVAMTAVLPKVAHVFLSVDTDGSVSRSLARIRSINPDAEIVFGNGGDRPDKSLPESEAKVCRQLGIKMLFGLGGNEKADSSTRINQELGFK